MELEKVRHVLEKCARCGQCRARCPTIDANDEGVPGWEVFSPRGRMQVAKGLLEGVIRPTRAALDGLFTCFYCNQCVETCPSLANVTDVVIAARKHLVEGGCAPASILQAHETITGSKNMFGLDQDDRIELWSGDVSDLVEAHVGKHAPLLYFVGCQASFKGGLANIPVRMVQILDKLGEDFTLLGEDEVCCGNPMELTGGPDEGLKELAEANVNKIAELGVRRVIFTCPGCYRVFKEVYPRLLGKGLPFSCAMASEYLAEKIRSKDIDLKPIQLPGKVVYHDPCELGRHMGVYDEPREVLRAIPGVDLVEFKHNKEDCNCCGMGGGAAMYDAKVSDFQARAKASDIAEVDACSVITHCPACFQGIEKACGVLNARGAGVEVLDLVEVVARALGIE
ncbi:MAG: (Fe-S)-binding protein [Candidatus Lokiarchaeota archaeon]|nr:(Fe-S)-binding protein [Candidatus Lokiarchaeota archaeon]